MSKNYNLETVPNLNSISRIQMESKIIDGENSKKENWNMLGIIEDLLF